MTLKISDVKVNDWLTCVDADDSLLASGNDYNVTDIRTTVPDVHEVGLHGVGGLWCIGRFIRRPFRVGDLVEFVEDYAPRVSKRCLAVVRDLDACAKFVTVSTSSGEVFQDVHVSKVSLVTPAHLIAKPQQVPPQAEPAARASSDEQVKEGRYERLFRYIESRMRSHSLKMDGSKSYEMRGGCLCCAASPSRKRSRAR